LPSIASVSRFRLRTRLKGDIAGTELGSRRGKLVSTPSRCAGRDARRSRGLFFNLPARRKFLKADTAESPQISRLVTQLALGYFDVGFTLRSGARVVLEAPPAGSLEERFFQLYGERPDLVLVSKQAAGITVRGFVAALGEQGPARGPQHVFVNQRIVKDRTIAHAIQRPTASPRSRSAVPRCICSSNSVRTGLT
jgi:DNA mismatch repair protein MutL